MTCCNTSILFSTVTCVSHSHSFNCFHPNFCSTTDSVLMLHLDVQHEDYLGYCGKLMMKWWLSLYNAFLSRVHGNINSMDAVFDAGFPTGVENMGGGGLCPPPSIGLEVGVGSSKFDRGLKSIHRGSMGQLKMLSKNTCERVHLIVKLPAISLQACKFTKNELLHTHFSRILARF